MIMIWDDHETADNSWRDGALNHNPARGEGPWPARETAAIQAYYEWLPIREVEPDNELRIYRRFDFGDLARLTMLDTRLIGRDEQLGSNVEDASGFTDTGAYADASRRMINADQLAWLDDALTTSQTTWQLIGQQIMFGQLKSRGAPNRANTENPGGQGGVFINSDQWDGYPRDRERVWQLIRGGQAAPSVAVDNVVVLTGDIHTSWAQDITEDPNNPDAYDPETGRGSMGVEFVGTSVTSPGSNGDPEPIKSQNPAMKYVELASRGYMLLDVTQERTQCEWWFVDDIKTRNAQQRLATTQQTRAGANHIIDGEGETAAPADAPALAPTATAQTG